VTSLGKCELDENGKKVFVYHLTVTPKESSCSGDHSKAQQYLLTTSRKPCALFLFNEAIQAM